MTGRDPETRAAGFIPDFGELDSTELVEVSRAAVWPAASPVRGFVLIAALIGLAAAGGSAFAGDDDDLVDEAALAPQQNERFVVIRNVQNIEANIDGWVYGNRRTGNNSQEGLQNLVKMKADVIARTTGLCDSQKRTLLLAGEGDIRRFIDRVNEIKLRHKATEFTMNDWNGIFREIAPLREKLARGLLDDDSLFYKTLRTMLTPEQAKRYARAEAERRLFQHRARVEMTVMHLGTQLGLREDQRKRVADLLLEKTRPVPTVGEQDQLLVLAQMSHLPDESLKPLFDARQWRELERLFERVSQLQSSLRGKGITLEDLQPAREKAVPARK